MKKIIRAVIAIVLIIILFYIGLFTLFLVSYDRQRDFFEILVYADFIFLSVWLLLWAFEIMNKKIRIASIMSLFLINLIAISACRLFLVQEVEETEADLRLYQPFAPDTKAVKLNEESSFKIKGELPRIDGATALYPMYAAFVQATFPEKEYDVYRSEVRGGTTPRAYERLLSGEADIIFCAKPSKEQQLLADSLGKVFNLVPIGREAFVFFVNKKNPVNGITSAQVKQIYSGEINNWKELGGEDEEIKAYQRPSGSGSQTMLIHIMNGATLMTPLSEDIIGGMGAIIDRTASYKNYNNSIGYSFLYYVSKMVANNKIKLLSIDGVYPSKENIENNKYPFSGDFYAITTDTNNENVSLLINWILSQQGRYLIEKTGYVPIK